MLGIGQKFPQFSLTGVVSNDLNNAFQPFDSNSNSGKWKIVFFWPKDFTFVCPTEIAAFGKLNREFKDRDAVVYGVSTDSEFVHLAWRKDKEELRNLPFPMLVGHQARADLGAGCARCGSRCGAACDVHRRSAGRDPLRLRDRPERRPQPCRSAARAGRTADRRAVPLQLEEG